MRIRIPFLESSDWIMWFESFKRGFVSQFQNVQNKESGDNDLNPYEEDSNSDSSKVFSDGWIRISIQLIRILDKKKDVKLKATNLNL